MGGKTSKSKSKCLNKNKIELINNKKNDEPIYSISSSASVQENDIDDVWQTKNIFYICKTEIIEISTAKNVIKLFDEGNTIPFIARYRRDDVGQLEPNKLRKIKSAYEYISKVNSKAKQLIANYSSDKNWTSNLKHLIQNAYSLEELEYLAAPFKKESKGTLAHRAKVLHLDEPAHIILNGTSTINLDAYVCCEVSGLENVTKVKEGIQHIIAEIISKTPEVQLILHKIVDSGRVILQSKKKIIKKENSFPSPSNYSTYENFYQMIMYVKPYQTFAIFRGEAENKLSVKIEIPIDEWRELKAYCQKKWIDSGCDYNLRRCLIMDSVKDAINRLLGPFVVRRVRSKLKKEAEEEAINIFEKNLKVLLLTRPLKGKVVMGIDPGYLHGCKVAVVSLQGELLACTKVFIPKNNANQKSKFEKFETKLKDLILRFSCETIALGNGKGCREMEVILDGLIKSKAFHPIQVTYTIVREEGVSVYSCSQEAHEEFPDLDPLYISAVSLARRLQDPLSELVKVEPKHLGVGLYQHDVKGSLLNSVLGEVVTECVSFVGVDVNTASSYLLRRVAGLNDSKAKEIVKYRKEFMGFRSLEELKNVNGISTKTFVQCAGFLRIVPSTAGWIDNYLDQTSIHPESYQLAETIAKRLKLDLREIGSEKFIKSVRSALQNVNLEDLKISNSSSEIDFITEIFCKPVDYDIRNACKGPVFKKEITNFEDLKKGQELTGIVNNIVPFGAFVDLGVGVNGLIHATKMSGTLLLLNDPVVVKIGNLDLPRKRIDLMLVTKII